MDKKEYQVLEINFLKRFSEEILQDKEDESIREKLRYLLQFYSIINFDLGTSGEKLLFRARKCDSELGFPNVNDISHPPKNLTKVNRLNKAGNPVLYLSHNMPSAFDEIEVKTNNIVQVATYKITRKLSVAIIGDIKNIFRWGSSKHSDKITDYVNRTLKELAAQNDDSLNSYIYTDSFLSQILKDKSAKAKSYIHSKSLFELISEKHSHIDGIAYEGIESSGARNLALTPQAAKSCLSINNIFLFKITNSYGFGLYDFQLLKQAKGHDCSGLINWYTATDA